MGKLVISIEFAAEELKLEECRAGSWDEELSEWLTWLCPAFLGERDYRF